MVSEERLPSPRIQPAPAQMPKVTTRISQDTARKSASGESVASTVITTKKTLHALGNNSNVSQVKRKKRPPDAEIAHGVKTSPSRPLLRQLPLTLPDWPDDANNAVVPRVSSRCGGHSSGSVAFSTEPSAVPLSGNVKRSSPHESQAQATAVSSTAGSSSRQGSTDMISREKGKGNTKDGRTISTLKTQKGAFWKDTKNRQILRSIRTYLENSQQGKTRGQEVISGEGSADSKCVARKRRMVYGRPEVQDLQEETAFRAANMWLREQMDNTRQRQPIITLERLLRQKRKRV